ncbi:MAG: thymidine phosphorylase [Robiginitomaculum sp.]|nr:thymidine phosphorylase [Robiginitomaculum sp.]
MEHSTFLPQEFLRQIRDGEKPSAADIRIFVDGIGTGATSKAQIGAFAMAVYKTGLGKDEIVALTKAMRDSGDVMTWDLPGPVLDKHSTGGVGDNVSLLLGPVVAACGGYVPMISGQGLGHTGGTLDKFTAIPGYDVNADNVLFRRTVKEIGCAIIGQTGALAPADKVLYATRSATATVDSVPLITASILAKKLAEGLDGLVLDIKCGNGAMMTDLGQAETLANSLISVANGAGVKTSGLITDMNQPLASAAGNALEVRNVIDHFAGKRDARLHEVTCALSAEMLVSGGLANDIDVARAKVDEVFANGKAAEVFAHMVSALGGPNDLLQNPDKYFPAAPIIKDIKATKPGIVSTIDSRAIGMAVIVMGGGRKRPDDEIDTRVGFDCIAPIGTKIEKNDVLARIHGATQDQAGEAGQMFMGAYTLSDAAPENPLIIKRMDENI